MPIIATAGHVDHGKSTLVNALTGRDPDRWAEEKERGLTIDLGFAWTTLAESVDVAFVDVPGHERFIKNMLAGIGGLDVALLVVAADGGWMPQTEEHTAVLDLLQIETGVIALSRIDLVDDDLRELAELEIAERIAGTTLDGWPVVAVSAVTGDGINDIRKALLTALESVKHTNSEPHLWVDRSFTVDGAGTVVTGTLTGGPLGLDSKLVTWPSGDAMRIRGLQTMERSVTEVSAGSRVALNLGGVGAESIERGTLLAPPDSFRPTARFLAQIRRVRSVEDVSDRGAYHIHAGSGSWPATLRILEDVNEQGGIALITTDIPVPLHVGDRLIVRDAGRQQVVAGGRVLDPHPAQKSRQFLPTAPLLQRALTDDGQFADTLLAVRGSATIDELRRDTGQLPTTGTTIADSVFTEAHLGQLSQMLIEQVNSYHSRYPLRPGAPKATLAELLDIDLAVVEHLAASNNELQDDGPTVRETVFEITHSPEDEAAWKRARAMLVASGLGVPRVPELGLNEEFLHAVIRAGKLQRITSDLVYLPEQMDEIASRLQNMDDGFGVAQFRDAMDISRRQAVPLLEWLDAHGWTLRRGDSRTVKRRL
ncbi:Selenocysteine-specific translation elongation factor [hydrothermal vent metagenome]|uniref:Selenocysteine-specific translation elongation factor n=1 Tax=hydrothermal vent metagenome TaxID=652676 RepID=A0A3B0SBC0_9ZZZZ